MTAQERAEKCWRDDIRAAVACLHYESIIAGLTQAIEAAVQEERERCLALVGKWTIVPQSKQTAIEISAAISDPGGNGVYPYVPVTLEEFAVKLEELALSEPYRFDSATLPDPDIHIGGEG